MFTYTHTRHTEAHVTNLIPYLQEHFDQGPAFDTEYPNKWPSAPSLSGFRPFMEAFYLQCDEVCITLVKALEAAFGVEDGSLVERCIPAATDLRLTHYPPITVGEMRSGKTSRIAPHSDFGIVTLLFQDSTGGLEVEDRLHPGTFAPVPPTDTMEMIVNVGDTLERWTNGKLFGGVHRVAIPEPMLKDGEEAVLPERYSVSIPNKNVVCRGILFLIPTYSRTLDLKYLLTRHV